MQQKLILHPDTFLWIKGDNGLLYNTKHFFHIHFKVTPGIALLCSKLLATRNLYTVKMDMQRLGKEEKAFVEEIIDSHCGKLYPADTPLVSLPPVLRVRKEPDQLLMENREESREELLKYYTSLTIQAGGEYKDNGYYRQTLYPVHSNRTLTTGEISGILQEYTTPYLRVIHLVLADLTSYAAANDLRPLVSGLHKEICLRLYTPASNARPDLLRSFMAGGNFVTLLYDEPGLLPGRDVRSIPGISHNFLVRTTEEFGIYSDYAKKLYGQTYEMIPVYDNNYGFFRENIFLSQDDLLNSKVKKHEIFMHQRVNSCFFGNLTILPDGRIYSNVNFPPLGFAGDPVDTIILQELEKNYAWRLIRDKKPCSECVWQWVCPSPANYELATGQLNTCTLPPEKITRSRF